MFGKPNSLLGRYEFESRQEYKGGATLNYWAGVICGMCTATILFLVMMFSVIEQNNELKKKVAELSVKVEKHDEIMQAYAFYNWHATLKMNTEDLEK
jgi:hypothetical protein